VTGEPGDRIWEVVVLDAGASMSVPEDQSRKTRWDTAQEAVLREANRLSARDRLAVIVAAPWPRLIHPFDEPRAVLPLQLAAVDPAAAPAAREEALRLARSLLDGRIGSRILLVTDRPLEVSTPDDGGSPIDFRIERVGRPTDNASILSVMFDSEDGNPLLGRLRVRVGYWGREPREVQVWIERAGGAPLLNERRTVDPQNTQEFATMPLPADGDTLVIRLSPNDALSVDNETTFRLPLRSIIRVAADDSCPPVLRLALENDPIVHLVESDLDADLVVGPMPVSAPLPSIVVSEGGGPAWGGRPVRSSSRSWLTRDLDFEGATCGTGASADNAGRGGEILLEAGDAVLAVLADAAGKPRLYLAPALLSKDTEAHRRPAFAVFLARAVRRLAGWEFEPAVFPSDRTIADPVWSERNGYPGSVISMPGSRVGADLSLSGPTDPERPPPARWTSPTLSELILAAAVALLTVEAILHARGRIP
jgi:hypothetical protein